MAELKKQVAELEAERDALRGDVAYLKDWLKGEAYRGEQTAALAEARGAQGLALQDELAHHRARIESSPEVWLWWGKDSNGEYIKRATTNPGRWGERPGLDHWERIEVVRAIPVEEEAE